ncbi:amino acid/amide ABC transporter ATP-binding protein 1 (HAAT family) [Tamaricihabitans halophyticus]|uniref:Amino acid/amide ABC transporter ATP-binding protein 1 (HAAT family) n=1 Tax=Tamaricihabitans halophyticus TaxID=1262583 RepID=A0A4R2QKL2_9PSEU|nr:ABC transporter ATP-binding protein [Tamaricihabitans halophyticus]TCP49973.1 amino acid/amide ABC transporter ATP-binding protein 1 (HAAT family) [Tamaricihabitans halophyticus]
MPVEAEAGLHASDITVSYGGVLANDRVTLDVTPGQVVGLIGPNGAGKTTFVDAVTGFTAAEGQVWLAGTRLDELAPHHRRAAGLSRTWQSGELFSNLTVAENIMVAARPGGLRRVWHDIFGRRDRASDLVANVLRTVGLADAEETIARDLTLGQQKLVGVARAMAGRCGLLLLDEPAAGLDSAESAAFAERLRAIAADGPGVLLIDHDMSLVLGVCDRVYVMEFGKVIFAGTPAQARRDPAVVAAYLGVPMEASHD